MTAIVLETQMHTYIHYAREGERERERKKRREVGKRERADRGERHEKVEHLLEAKLLLSHCTNSGEKRYNIINHSPSPDPKQVYLTGDYLHSEEKTGSVCYFSPPELC